jgi:hypothetical protein
MNKKEVSLISAHPFVQRFVLSVIRNIREKNFNYEERTVIHADLVPKVSESVMIASMTPKVVEAPEIEKVEHRETSLKVIDMSELVAPIEKKVEKFEPKRIEINKMDMSALVAPIRRPEHKRPVVRPEPVVPQRVPIKQVAPPIRDAPVTQKPSPIVVGASPEGEVSSEGYGKISPLLDDPSISTIECEGAGKPVMVIRAGQRQITRIVLTPEDVKGVLDKVADEAHVPLLEGVFRATITGFSINAVISEMIGSRFVIKKATAYSLLE